MEFASVLFIWGFLPLTLILYAIAAALPGGNAERRKNIVLLVMSLLFYAFGGFRELLLFVLSALVNYGAGRLIEKSTRKKTFLIAAIGADVLLLVFFKYFNMLVTMLEIFTAGGGLRQIGISLLKLEGTGALGVKAIAMPLAISFYTFQSVSYLADVYTGKVKAERNPARFCLYMSFFAQLSQGPIMRYGDLGTQIGLHPGSVEMFLAGMRRFCYGLAKKVLIANTVAAVVDEIWAQELNTIGSGVAWLGVLLYTLQIYYDFSGYTDMAIGVGAMFGFRIAENFDYPYTSLSIQEFWRRWHMSLSFWFRDYIYIPLGGNRKGQRCTLRNLFVVFLLTGIWHGANLTFLLWGILFALFSIWERVSLGALLKKNPIKPLNWLYTTFVVMMGWVLFRAPNLWNAGQYFRQLFCFRASPVGTTVLSYLNMEVCVAIVAGVLLAGFLQRPLRGLYERLKDNLAFRTVDTAVQLLLAVWCVMMIVGGSYNPSIYGKF